MTDRQPPDAAGITRNGLRVNRDKLAAWQRRGAERYAAKQRARKSAARLTSRINRPGPVNDWPAKVRKAARQRSGGRCELCGFAEATHLHHRQLRRHGDHRIVNALHVCATCHGRVHSDRDVQVAYDAGWLVRSFLDPADVAVVLTTGPAYLLEDGTWRAAA